MKIGSNLLLYRAGYVILRIEEKNIHIKFRRDKKMEILKLKPACKDYLWGGRRLIEEFGKKWEKEKLAETWELSAHKDGPSIILNGKFEGKSLSDFLEIEGKEVLGENCKDLREFPILIKLIDANDNLSIQVHPNDDYALKNENQYGKTEVWYVLDATEDAYLYFGFKEEISKEEFKERIENDTLLEVLNKEKVKKGDVFFIPAGTIHAIGAGIMIAEIQQSSNVTYRVYDFGRVDKNGNRRELHIDKAVEVTNLKKSERIIKDYPVIAECDYFKVEKIEGGCFEGRMDRDSFRSLLILEGEGRVKNDDTDLSFKKGDSLFLPAGEYDYEVKGSFSAVLTWIPKKAVS